LQAKDHRGERSYSPRMMTALILYGYATGVFSARRIARACIEDVPFRVIAGNEQPFFTTVNEFRATHRPALARLFGQEPQDLPAELQRREGRLAKIRAIRAALEKEAAAARATELREQAAALRST